jgi:hypothetical protein
MQRRADPHERGRLREQRQLDRMGGFAASGHIVVRSVTQWARGGQKNRRPSSGGISDNVIRY